jgi:hypothetical protein
METPEVREMKNSDVPSRKLDRAIARAWPGFSCMKCSGFTPMERDPQDWTEDNLK